LATLRAAGVEPVVITSGVDEAAVLADAERRFGTLGPVDAVLLLAQAKAEDVARRLDDGGEIVLGCDSMLEFDGRAFGKPADAAEARQRWRAMRGKSGVLHTGHWVLDQRESSPDAMGKKNAAIEASGTGATFGATASTTVYFADLSDDEIDAYIATGEPLHVAGAFTIDGLGGPYIERIEGDHHNVVGLSLPLLRGMLGEIGVRWTDLCG
jgi:septum formation protein